MKKTALLLVALAATLTACRNNAISYAHALDPHARCNAIVTVVSLGHGDADTATCVSGREVWFCVATASDASCSKKGDVVVEAKP